VSQLQFIDQQRLHYPVQLLCQTLCVVPSRYYAWRKGVVAGVVAPAEPAWETALVDVFDDHQRRYGTRRLRVELRELGHQVGRQAIRTALRRQARKVLQPKAFVPRTTDSTHGKRCAPNLLLDQPKPTQANRVWVSRGITYLPWPTATGFIAVPFRTCAPSRWWAGKCGLICQRRWLPRPYSGPCSPSGPRPA
jgi:putative transposase